MRYVAMLMVLASLPAFMAMLGAGAQYRKYAFFALGALPILGAGLNVDANFYALYGWRGHTKGMVLSLTDTLALAVLLTYLNVKQPRTFLMVWLVYAALNIPGVFVSDFFMASFSSYFTIMRAVIYFSACFVVMMQGGMQPLVLGLACSVLANSYVTIKNGLMGGGAVEGLVGHRNTAGLVNNLVVPTLVVAVLTWKQARIPALAVAAAAVAATLGGSRAAVILFGASIVLPLLAAIVIKPGKRTATIVTVVALGATVMVPAVVVKMTERFQQQGESFSLEPDGERLAFERASAMMNADFPLGVGHNQYAIKSNAGGYAARAGVGWSTVGNVAIVHNSYVLARTEGGHAALLGLYILLGSFIVISAQLAMKKKANPGRLYAVAVFVAISVLAVHLNYEWQMAASTTLYLFGFNSALLAMVAHHAKAAAKKPVRRNPRPLVEDRAAA